MAVACKNIVKKTDVTNELRPGEIVTKMWEKHGLAEQG